MTGDGQHTHPVSRLGQHRPNSPTFARDGADAPSGRRSVSPASRRDSLVPPTTRQRRFRACWRSTSGPRPWPRLPANSARRSLSSERTARRRRQGSSPRSSGRGSATRSPTGRAPTCDRVSSPHSSARPISAVASVPTSMGRRMPCSKSTRRRSGRSSPRLGPCVIVATNLFRDQLDRFGEPDAIVDRWVAALATAAEGSTLVYCVDDPRLSMLASAARLPTRSFGLVAMPMDREQRSTDIGAIADPVTCPRCGRQLMYAWRSIGHLGAYCVPRRPHPASCPGCRDRMVRERAEAAALGAWATGTTIRISGSLGSIVIRPRLPGPPERIQRRRGRGCGDGDRPQRRVECAGHRGLSGSVREERMDGHRWASRRPDADQEHREPLGDGPTRLSFAPDAVVLGLNDAAADGRDVSWIWDAPIAELVRGATSS